jgi:hypothetical protein
MRTARAYVFVGPTVPAETARAEIDAVILPPAAGGDIYRAALSRPAAIGLIDGYFERLPSVWHKEILWAMAEGIHVFGAASMGALRAAELAAFGMEGMGAIFAAYRDGVLEDDDEVAVAHAGPEEGYRALSEPLVSIRATLDAAESAAVIDPAARATLERLAKESFYPERSYPLLLGRAGGAGVAAATLDAFRLWLPAGRIDQKLIDGVEMLRRMTNLLRDGLPPKQVHYTLEQTEYWERIQRDVSSEQAAG